MQSPFKFNSDNLAGLSAPAEHIEFGGMKFIEFRSVKAFERFDDWLIAMTHLNAETLGFDKIRCSLTGEVYAMRMESETEFMLRSLAVDGNRKFNPVGAEYFPRAVFSEALRVWDEVSNRFITAMRPSHAFALGNSRNVIALMSPKRQATALITKLVCEVHNNGMAELYKRGSDGVFARNVMVLEVADLFESHFEDSEFGALYAALVELDAKYNLETLAMVNKEKAWFAEAFEKFMGAQAWDLNALVRAMTSRRDEMTEIDVSPRWSQRVYRTKDFHTFAGKMQAFIGEAATSNLYDANANTPSNRHVAEYKAKMAAKSAEKTAQPKSKRPAPKTQKQAEKAAMRAKFKFSFSAPVMNQEKK